MKTRNFKNRNMDFSKQFDNLTLMDIVNPVKVNPVKVNPVKETTYNPPLYTANPESDPDNLIGRMVELPPIIPARYVWHVSHRGYSFVEGKRNLKIFSVARQGILREYNHYGSAVFAHNKLVSLSSFYPFCIDGAFEWGQPLHDLTPSAWFRSCGFWRIDTSVLDCKWYIDPNLKDGGHFGSGTAINFICTPYDIPPYALKYFEFNMESYIMDLPKLLHQKDYRLHVKYLKPVDEVNEWIKRFERAA